MPVHCSTWINGRSKRLTHPLGQGVIYVRPAVPSLLICLDHWSLGQTKVPVSWAGGRWGFGYGASRTIGIKQAVSGIHSNSPTHSPSTVPPPPPPSLESVSWQLSTELLHYNLKHFSVVWTSQRNRGQGKKTRKQKSLQSHFALSYSNISTAFGHGAQTDNALVCAQGKCQ